MLNSINIKYFETHLDTIFDLHPGVNVVIGESDEGKSGIIRAITWNSDNRPQGDSYRNDQLDAKLKTDKLKNTSVAIDYKGTGLVTRARNGVIGGVNTYQIETEEPLRALRTDVPDEVKDITRMKSVNIQGQHPTEQYFLLADKPGQVAKELNKVSGLAIMDKATGIINAQVRVCNTEIKLSEKAIKNHQKDIDDTAWVDDAERFANKLDTFVIKIDSKQTEYDTLNSKVRQVLKIDDIIEKQYKGLDDALWNAGNLEKEQKAINDKEHEQEIINELILAMKSVDKELKNSIDTEKALKALKELKTLENDIEDKEQNRNEINNLIYKLTTIEIKIQDAIHDCKEVEEEYGIIRREEECPTCGRTGN